MATVTVISATTNYLPGFLDRIAEWLRRQGVPADRVLSAKATDNSWRADSFGEGGREFSDLEIKYGCGDRLFTFHVTDHEEHTSLWNHVLGVDR